jgi:hypothetical protein
MDCVERYPKIAHWGGQIKKRTRRRKQQKEKKENKHACRIGRERGNFFHLKLFFNEFF